MKDLITQAAASNGVQTKETTSVVQQGAKNSINAMLSSILDRENYRKRFDELLGKRAPQFISSIVSLVNADANLQLAFAQSPITIIQAALKAATYDLPIDPALGYAYIVPFKNKKNGKYVTEATFIPGYKGLIQLALRTGVYKTINVVDIRAGELKEFNRLTEEKTLVFIDDEEERVKLPIVGYMGFFKLLNGTEKTIYRTIPQLEAHELANRKGENMGKGWRENFGDMCKKTVLRELIGKWGLMSIDYRTYDEQTLTLAQAVAEGTADNMPYGGDSDYIVSDGKVIDASTGEVVSDNANGDGDNE